MSICWRPESRHVFNVWIYAGTAACSLHFTLCRQHLLFDPFTINTLSITHRPHFREKYKEMACITACSLRAWTQSALQSRRATQTMMERHCRVPYCQTVTLLAPGDKGEQQETGYYYYLVCNFRLDMTEEWQVKVPIVTSKEKSVEYKSFKSSTQLHSRAKEHWRKQKQLLYIYLENTHLLDV